MTPLAPGVGLALRPQHSAHVLATLPPVPSSGGCALADELIGPRLAHVQRWMRWMD